jgi:hypothetical protein
MTPPGLRWSKLINWSDGGGVRTRLACWLRRLAATNFAPGYHNFCCGLND